MEVNRTDVCLDELTRWSEEKAPSSEQAPLHSDHEAPSVGGDRDSGGKSSSHIPERRHRKTGYGFKVQTYYFCSLLKKKARFDTYANIKESVCFVLDFFHILPHYSYVNVF